MALADPKAARPLLERSLAIRERVPEGGALEVATGDGVLEVLQIQPEGGAEMDGATFLSTMRGGASARFSSLESQVVEGGRRQH